MRIVLDTNVWVAGLLWSGPPHTILRLARQRRLTICTSPAILAELHEVLRYPKLQPRLRALGITEEDAMLHAVGLSVIVETPSTDPRAPLVAADPDDDCFLLCAVAAEAAAVVSGDAHLLQFGHHGNVAILTPRSFLDRHFPTESGG